MVSAEEVMSPSDEEKPKAGRPPRQGQEPLGQSKLYRADLRRLNDITRWRKERLNLSHYALADTVRDLFRESIERERDAEDRRQKGEPEPPVTPAEPVVQLFPLTPISDGRHPLPFVGPVSAGTPLQVFEQPGETFDLGEQFGGPGRYVFRVKGESMVGERIFPKDYVIIRRTPQFRVGEDVVAVVDGELTLKKVVRKTDKEVRLAPCNGESWNIVLDPTRGDTVLGALVAVFRKK